MLYKYPDKKISERSLRALQLLRHARFEAGKGTGSRRRPPLAVRLLQPALTWEQKGTCSHSPHSPGSGLPKGCRGADSVGRKARLSPHQVTGGVCPFVGLLLPPRVECRPHCSWRLLLLLVVTCSSALWRGLPTQVAQRIPSLMDFLAKAAETPLCLTNCTPSSVASPFLGKAECVLEGAQAPAR